jgi:hypothetical protein
LVFKKLSILFAENWSKIAENCDHSIGNWIHRCQMFSGLWPSFCTLISPLLSPKFCRNAH